MREWAKEGSPGMEKRLKMQDRMGMSFEAKCFSDGTWGGGGGGRIQEREEREFHL